MPTEIGLALEQLLTNRLGQSADTGLNTAQNLGIFRQNKSLNVADLLNNIGQLRAQSELSAGKSKADQASNLLQTATSIATQAISPGAGGGTAGTFGKFFFG